MIVTVAYIVGWLATAVILLRSEREQDVAAAAFSLLGALAWPFFLVAWAFLKVATIGRKP